MGAASDYLRQIGKPRLSSVELNCFIEHVAGETTKADRQASIDHLLRVVDLEPDQLVALAASSPVRQETGLQHSIQRYARSKEFEASQRAAENEPAWKTALNIIFSISPY